MHTDELKEALTKVASTVDTLPGFTERVVLGGRRRRRRRLLVLATALSTVAALGFGALAWTFLNQFRPDQLTADARFGQNALGPRAGDDPLRREALAVFARDWAKSLPQPGPAVILHGQPHVYWAGETAAGPAVVLLQRVGRSSGESTMPALVGRAPGETALRLLAVDLPAEAGALAGAFLFGQEDRTLLTLTQPGEVRWSPGLRVAVDGKVTRDFQRLDFVDGVALAQVPPEIHPATSVITTVGQAAQVTPLRPRLASAYPRELARLTGSADRENDADPGTGTGIRQDGVLARRLIAAPTIRPPDEIRVAGAEALGSQGYLDPFRSKRTRFWDLLAGLPDSRSVYLTEVSEGGPTRLYSVLLNARAQTEQVIYGGPGEPSALPVRVRLPGEDGWVVAGQDVRLSWRTGPSAAWQEAGQDAALLPATATEVRAVSSGKTVEFRLG
ncbi:ubiquinol-cytochrome c reductase iron-sulfur subunit N-terminal domain-containing protein [Crossiella sp. CA198]|uniref:ubiquinol-cytochrome c reductase iron-sulfur subunit N-terminal domain-containing protein n=1 Tax=Crossiella sp. CA198 TaxID=3455607 RepID=UPI003F8D242B